VGGREHDLGGAQRKHAVAVDPLDAHRQRGGGGLHARDEEARVLVGDDEAGALAEGCEQALAGAESRLDVGVIGDGAGGEAGGVGSHAASTKACRRSLAQG
jgi:hypothetical protein